MISYECRFKDSKYKKEKIFVFLLLLFLLKYQNNEKYIDCNICSTCIKLGVLWIRMFNWWYLCWSRWSTNIFSMCIWYCLSDILSIGISLGSNQSYLHLTFSSRFVNLFFLPLWGDEKTQYSIRLLLNFFL
jgi:hypothetical protein